MQNNFISLSNDDFIKEFKDKSLAFELGFKLFNKHKNEISAKKENKDVYLSIKHLSIYENEWAVYFNNLTSRKISSFKKKNLWLAISVWDNKYNLTFVVFGRFFKIAEILQQNLNNNEDSSLLSIPIEKLICEYEFKIIPISLKSTDIEILLKLHYKSRISWWKNSISDKNIVTII